MFEPCRIKCRIRTALLILSILWATAPVVVAAERLPSVTFAIRTFVLEGNTIFADDSLQKALVSFLGNDKTAADVEGARTALEAYYHQRGYPTALVNIPEQRVQEGVIRLEVIESTIYRVRVKGNRYFTRERLLKEMPAFRPGEILFLPDVKKPAGQSQSQSGSQGRPSPDAGQEARYY